MSTFNLYAIVAQTVRVLGDNVDPDQVSDFVVDSVPDEHLRSALRTAIRPYVRGVLHMENRALRQPEPPLVGVGAKPRTSRVNRYYQAHPEAREWGFTIPVDELINVGGVWKRLRKLTPAELDLAAQERFKKAEETRQYAEELLAIKAACERAGARTVEELLG